MIFRKEELGKYVVNILLCQIAPQTNIWPEIESAFTLVAAL